MRKFLKRYYSQLLCILISAALCTCLGAVIARSTIQHQPQVASVDADSPAMQKAAEIQQYLDTYFIGEIDEDTMADAVAEGVIAGTGDRWSYYISADDYDQYMESIQNAYVGVGITIQLLNEDDAGFTVMSVSPGGPAAEAGIMPGDLLTKVEGRPVADMDVSEAQSLVRGEEGTQVRITFSRDGVEKEYALTRSVINVVNVTGELLQNEIGYLTIGNFDANCAADTIAMIEDLREQGATKLIFDVRFNPGGFKDELVALLDYLLPEGKLFISEDYTGEERVDYSDENFLDMDMVVLVNEDSYSAAEFFAAALQEYGAAQVIGTQTSGKGYFQTTFPLSDGSAISISVGKYRTPNGVSLAEAGGLVPDQMIELDEEKYIQLYQKELAYEDDPQLQAAIDALS